MLSSVPRSTCRSSRSVGALVCSRPLHSTAHLGQPEARESVRASQVFRFKHQDSLNGKLSWEHHVRVQDPRTAVQLAMSQYGGNTTPSARFASVANLSHSIPKLPVGDEALSTIKSFPWNQSPLPKAEPIVLPRSRASRKYEDLPAYGPYMHHEKKKASPLPYKDLSKYRSARLDSDFQDGAAPVYASSTHNKPESHIPPAASEYKDTGLYKAVRWREPNGLRPLTAEEKSKDYNDLHQYGPVSVNKPPKDGTIPMYADTYKYTNFSLDVPETTIFARTEPTPEIPTITIQRSENPGAEYRDLDKYGPVMWSEPDGLRPLAAEEKSKVYDDLHMYGPVMWNEPDGLRPLMAEEKSKAYDDLHIYGAVRWNEPDGLRPLTAEELSKNYTDLDLYGKGVHHNEPDGRVPPTKEELSKNYKDLGHYLGPFSHNEPDGLPAGQTRESRLNSMARVQSPTPIFSTGLHIKTSGSQPRQ